MISRPAPKPGDRRPADSFVSDAQVQAWVKRMAGDPNAVPGDLSEAQLHFVIEQVLGRRGMGLRTTDYEKALRQTAPVLSVPQMDDPVGDLAKAFQLPEMEAWWGTWQAMRGARGPQAAADLARKALLCVRAMTGFTPHANSAHQLLDHMPALRAVFADLEERSRGARVEDIDPHTETAVNKRSKKFELVLAGLHLTNQVTINLIRSLEQIHGSAIAHGWLIDGSATPAWAPQRGASSSSTEARLRRWAPEAGFRAIGWSDRGKLDLRHAPDNETARVARGGKSKTWRGFYTVPLLNQATNLGICQVVDARSDEARTLIPHMSDLHRYWPGVDMRWIAGDSAWDEEWACRLMEVNYGVHPIFRLHDDRGPIELLPGCSPNNAAAFLTHTGEVICRAHGKPIRMDQFERPGRNGLAPGQQGDASWLRKFRWRGTCEHTRDSAGRPVPPCGSISVTAIRKTRVNGEAAFEDVNWRRLAHFPHSAKTDPERFAFREVILRARLGQAESYFQVMKSAHMLLGAGAGRARIADRMEYEMLVALANLIRAAMTVYDQRVRAGLMPPLPDHYVGRDRRVERGLVERITATDQEGADTSLGADTGTEADTGAEADCQRETAGEATAETDDARGADVEPGEAAQGRAEDRAGRVPDPLDDLLPARTGASRSRSRHGRRRPAASPPGATRRKGHLSLIPGGRS